MNVKELINKRLFNQQLSYTEFSTPADLVFWMGAVQAQDYAMSKWAIGLRLKSATDAMIEDAISDGAILRTHVLRPTWHLVHADDIRWMLKLTAPQIQRQMVYYDRQLGIDKKELVRSAKLFEKTLQGLRHMTRTELSGVFTKAKFNCEGIRFGHLLMHAELQGILCSGARKGKHISYALLEERVPQKKEMSETESLMKLVSKYFQSHGPATLKDFIWWSGLSPVHAKQGVSLLENKINSVIVEGQEYFFIGDNHDHKNSGIILLPNYDEYIVGYNNRDAIMTRGGKEKISREGNPVFTNTILVNGIISGSWKREIKAGSVVITETVFDDLSATAKAKIKQARKTVEQFLISQ